MESKQKKKFIKPEITTYETELLAAALDPTSGGGGGVGYMLFEDPSLNQMA